MLLFKIKHESFDNQINHKFIRKNKPFFFFLKKKQNKLKTVHIYYKGKKKRKDIVHTIVVSYQLSLYRDLSKNSISN